LRRRVADDPCSGAGIGVHRASTPGAPSQEDLLEHRIGAALIDLVLLAALLAILATTIGESRVKRHGFSFWLDWPEAGLYLALVLVYYFALEATIGQTVGKLLLGLRVVRADGSRPTVAAIAIRTLLRVVDWLPFFYLVGFIALLATDLRCQRLGDLAAKTSVPRTVPVPHRGFAAVAVAAVVLALLGLSGYRATVSDEGLSDLRVCTGQAFDEGGEECTKDQREQPLRGRTVYCSAKVEGREGRQFTGRVLYQGELYYTSPGRAVPAGAGTFSVRFGVGRAGRALLPGGRWACELSVDSEKMKASFESAGTTAPLLDLAVCPTANTMTGRLPVCRQDESDAPWSQPIR
jgi:uncharacterized RDD family membrane protein YckC